MSKIITSEDLGDYMGETLGAARAEQVINAVNQWIETRTGRCWGETKQVTRRLDYKRTVWLRDMDIVSIDGVQVGVPNETPVDLEAEDYYFSDLGRLTVGSGFSNPLYRNDGRYVGVTYTHGTEDVPDDLKLAALGIAAGYYNWAVDGGREIDAASVGSYRLEFQSGDSSSNKADSKSMSSRMFDIINSYKIRKV